MRVPTACAVSIFAAAAQAQPEFRIHFSEDLERPVAGRLVVTLAWASEDGRGPDPGAAPFLFSPMPMYGRDVAAEPGDTLVLDAFDDVFPRALAEFEPGRYRAVAVLDSAREASDRTAEAGNLVSEIVSFELGDGPVAVAFVLAEASPGRVWERTPGATEFSIRSELLSDFHGRDIELRAGVVYPIDHDPARWYPAVYSVPGFGGDHLRASRRAEAIAAAEPDDPRMHIHGHSFYIILDPESGNGHTLFADSANNGPVGRALVEELIPALEERFRLVADPGARVVTGHSSGGWSSLWLAIEYPDTFGACFSSAPDPVDFRFFQSINAYEDESWYTAASGEERASVSRDGKVYLTIREENQMEEVLGPRNTAAQQWDSWLAVWGPRAGDGNPAALYDPRTGAIDHAIAERFRAYDIRDRVLRDPERYLPLFAERVRLICGDEDNFDLHLAVEALRSTLVGRGIEWPRDGSGGYITLVPGEDHGTLLRSEAYTDFYRQMHEFFRAAGHAD